ncbi:MAG: nucleotidyltransferase family protein [Pirellulaceae bacterium]|nr:nucleotidyltransferase family protein [Pirellulaceae bacterium]
MKESLPWIPTSSQQLLLRALLHTDLDQAGIAINQWLQTVNIKRLDFGSYRLLPLLWKRAVALDWDLPDLNMIKGIYRRTWYANQLHLTQLLTVTQALRAENCEVLWLKGAALIVNCYHDIGVRPISDVDILVKPDDTYQTIETLVDAGWVPQPTPLTVSRTSNPKTLPEWVISPRPLNNFDPAYFIARHGHAFSKSNECEIDLHWRLIQEFDDSFLDEHSWKTAEPCVWRDTDVLVPEPACHLLFLLLHGCRWNTTPAIRWIADSTYLIRSHGNRLDWKRFQELSARGNVCGVLSRMLYYLKNEMGVDVPNDCLKFIASHPTPSKTQRRWDTLQHAPGMHAALLELSLLRGRYRQYRHAQKRTAKPRTFLSFIQHCIGAPSLTSFAKFATKEIVRRTLPHHPGPL